MPKSNPLTSLLRSSSATPQQGSSSSHSHSHTHGSNNSSSGGSGGGRYSLTNAAQAKGVARAAIEQDLASELSVAIDDEQAQGASAVTAEGNAAKAQARAWLAAWCAEANGGGGGVIGGSGATSRHAELSADCAFDGLCLLYTSPSPRDS